MKDIRIVICKGDRKDERLSYCNLQGDRNDERYSYFNLHGDRKDGMYSCCNLKGDRKDEDDTDRTIKIVICKGKELMKDDSLVICTGMVRYFFLTYYPGESSDEGDYKCNLFVNSNANRKEREMLKDTSLIIC